MRRSMLCAVLALLLTAAPAAADKQQWDFVKSGSEVLLVYGIPESEAVTLSFICAKRAVEGAAPRHCAIEIAGPERAPLHEFVGRFLRATKDPREVVSDTNAPYFGMVLNDQSLNPGADPRIGPTRFQSWLSHSLAQR